MKNIAQEKTRKLVMVLIITLIMTSLASCSGKESSNNGQSSSNEGASVDKGSKDVVMTVGKEKYTLQDIMYDIYSVESQCSQEAMWSSMMGVDYWTETDDDGNTNADLAKDNVISSVVWTKIMSDKATEAGYKLEEVDKEQMKDDIDAILSDMSDEYKKKTGFTQEYLSAKLEKEYLAWKYYDAQLEKIEVDEEKIKEQYDYEEYRQYMLEYILVPTMDYDEEGNEIPYSEEEIQKAKQVATGMLQEVLDGKTLEEAHGDDENTEYGEMPVEKEDEYTDEKIVELALKLKNDEVYEKLVETSEGYYIIKMLDNDSHESYQETIDSEIATQKEEKYQETFDKLVEEYGYEVNQEIWDTIEMKNFAYEEPQDIQEEEDEEAIDEEKDEKNSSAE